jgi:putative acetyltransferase
MADMQIREFRFGDEPALHTVFHSAIHQIACADYSAEQINAWSPAEMNPAQWAGRMRAIKPFVVEHDGQIVAYADVQSNGYIGHFFVSGTYPRRGFGTVLMGHIHQVASTLGVSALTSDVSRTAQPFFQRFGFAVVEQRSPVVRGVVVPNALMRKELADASLFGREPWV